MTKNKRISLIAVALMSSSVLLSAQDVTQTTTTLTATPPAARPAPCSVAGFRAFDFWVGEWDVTTPDGSPAGTSKVEMALGGCVLIEHWTAARREGMGMSINTFDPASGRWTQRWVDNGGMVAQMEGEFEGKNLVYRREFKRRDGTPVMSRMTFTDLGGEGVRQLVERSLDGGKTWNTDFDGRYHRRKDR